MHGLNGHCFTEAVLVFLEDEYVIEEESGSVSICMESGVISGFETALTVSLTAQDGTACELNYVCIYQVIVFDSSL